MLMEYEGIFGLISQCVSHCVLADACEEAKGFMTVCLSGCVFKGRNVLLDIFRRLVGDSERAFSGYIAVDTPYRLYVP